MSTGASSSAGVHALITQVQLLNVHGRIGGSEGSDGMRAFSDEFGESRPI